MESNMSEGREGNDSLEDLRAEIARLQQENEKLRASNRRWMRIAGTDDLTGLPNKVYFSSVILPQVISQAKAGGESFVCIIITPDKLGEINQNYGRTAGDQVVCDMAKFLKEHIEKNEKIIHSDGANFILLIPNGGEEACKRRTRQMRARIVSRQFECGSSSVSLTLSMGTVIVEPDPFNEAIQAKDVADQIMHRLSAALDQVKKAGGDQIVDGEAVKC